MLVVLFVLQMKQDCLQSAGKDSRTGRKGGADVGGAVCSANEEGLTVCSQQKRQLVGVVALFCKRRGTVCS